VIDRLRLAEVIAAQIEEQIIADGWRVGEVFGSEPELIDRFQVSRAVFREAARIVEHHNVAYMRPGPNGGLVITAPNEQAVLRPMSLFLQYNNVSAEETFAARTIIELEATAEATRKLTEQDSIQLRQALLEEEDLGVDTILLKGSHRLHTEIARISGNRVMMLFVEILGLFDLEMVHSAGENPASAQEAADASHRAHVAIVDAIVRGDAALATNRMRTHLDAIAQLRLLGDHRVAT
jgi:DNA-binding FadR family transcriptional regulator